MSTTTLLAGAIIITPVAVDTVDVSRAGGVLVHEVLGRPDPDVTIRPGGLRTGTLSLTFGDEAPAKAALDALAVAGVVQATSSAVSLTMSFVVPVGQTMTLSRDGSGYWRLSVPFQEVQP